MAPPPISPPPSDSAAATAADLEALRELIRRVRDVVRRALPTDEIASEVAGELRTSVPGPHVLDAGQRVGHPDHYEQHVLHVEEDGSFSIVALVWRPGQQTPIHDHVCWCVVAVVEGMELETIYDVHEETVAPYLRASDCRRNTAGSVCSFAPPGDIHSVHNAGAGNAISLHIYGADISALGTSVRRIYDVPVREAPA